MKLTICILIVLNVILSFLQAQPHQRGGQGQAQGQHHHPPVPPLFMLLDKNQDGALSAEEIEAATEIIKNADSNGDGQVALQELLPPPHFGQGGQGGHGGQGGRHGGHPGGQHGGRPGPSSGQPSAPQSSPIPSDYYRE